MDRILHVLTGATAVGKTELALRWAEANHAEIVSCDALLVYCGMDIGTAKPTAEERARVPHHLIDVCEVNERMDIVCYVAKAQAAVADILARGRKVLIAGGSGFYLKAFFAPVADTVAVVPALRAEIEAKLAAEGLGALVTNLRGLNPGGLGELDTNNPRRVTRALERCRSAGRSLRELAEDFARQPGAFEGWTVRCTRLERPPEELNPRIKVRVDAMLAGGLVDEVRRLRAAGLEDNPSASRAIGYRETLTWLTCEKQGIARRQAPTAELAEEIVKNTRGLVKKQRTWFRTQLPEHRVVAAAEVRVETLFA